MKVHVLVKDSLTVGVLMGLGVMLTTILSILLTRSLPTYEYGVYSFLVNLALWGSMFVVLGLDFLSSREVAKFSAKSNFDKILSLIILSFLLMLVSWFVVVSLLFIVGRLLFLRDLSPVLLFYTALLIFGQSLLSFDSGVLLGLNRVFVSQLVRSVSPWLMLILILAYTTQHLSVYFILKLQSMIFVIMSLVVFFVIVFVSVSKRGLGFNLLFRGHKLVNLFSSAIPFAFITVLSSSLAFVPIFFLKIFGKYHDIALFDVASKVSLLITFALSSINLVISPKTVHLYQSSKYDDLKELISTGSLISFIFAFLVFMGILVYGKIALSVIWGDNYGKSFVALVILALGEVINAFSGPVALLLNMTDHERVVLKVMIICLFFSTMASLLLIPYLGLEGAAIVKSMTTILWNLLLVYYVTSILKINPTALSKTLWLMFKSGAQIPEQR